MNAGSAAAVIAAAVALAIKWARDDSHGYDQSNRWGPDFDCSSFLIAVWEAVGVHVREAGATYTGNMAAAFLACGFRDVTGQVDLYSGAGLQAGDVLLNVRSHTAMCVGGGLIVHAAGNEHGGATGGQSGDQTGREICTAGYYYSPSHPWEIVLRFFGSAEIPEEPVSNLDHAGSYTVQAGDSLWAIAERCGSTVEELARINGIQDPALIHPGQVLRLPGASEPAAEPETEGGFLAEMAEIPLPVLSEGASGQIVESVQLLLLNAGIDVGSWGVDGDYGHDTWMAVCDFQRMMGLPSTGKVDGKTWAALLG